MPERIKITDLAKDGYWFCRTCERVTEPEEHDHGQPTSCALCGAASLNYCPPVPDVGPGPRQYLIELQGHRDTRWPFPDSDFIELLTMLARASAAGHSIGPAPAATVKRIR